MFWLALNLLALNVLNYKNIACIDFVHVNIALKSRAYEKSFLLEFIKKLYFLLLFKS